MEYQYFRIEDRGEERIVYCECEELVADLEVKKAGKELLRLCLAARSEDKKGVILDLGAVRSMASSMPAKVFSSAVLLVKQGRTFRICNVSPLVEEVFVETEMAALFDVTRVDGTPVTIAKGPDRGDTVHFPREQGQNRRKVFEALEEAGYRWMEDYKTLEVHFSKRIEVCGVRHERDAHHILELLRELYPTWHHEQPSCSGKTQWGWHVAIYRAPDSA